MAYNWISNLKNKWRNFVSENDSSLDESDLKLNAQQSIKPIEFDYIKIQQNLSDNIIASIKSLKETGNFSIEEHQLIIYIKDALLFQACSNDRFKMRLADIFHMEYGNSFKNINIEQGEPSHELASHTVIQGMASFILERQTQLSKSLRASISILADQGELMDGRIILDSITIKELPGQCMNIGIGRSPKLDNGSIRYNHIAINNDPNSLTFEMNKFVSRAHANIRFKDKEGFVIYVEQGGTPERGKRTMISRNGKITRLDIKGMGFPLQNGDQIILSRSVILHYEILKD